MKNVRLSYDDLTTVMWALDCYTMTIRKCAVLTSGTPQEDYYNNKLQEIFHLKEFLISTRDEE